MLLLDINVDDFIKINKQGRKSTRKETQSIYTKVSSINDFFLKDGIEKS